MGCKFSPQAVYREKVDFNATGPDDASVRTPMDRNPPECPPKGGGIGRSDVARSLVAGVGEATIGDVGKDEDTPRGGSLLGGFANHIAEAI